MIPVRAFLLATAALALASAAHADSKPTDVARQKAQIDASLDRA